MGFLFSAVGIGLGIWGCCTEGGAFWWGIAGFNLAVFIWNIEIAVHRR